MSRRPGSDAAAELFASDDAMRWAECLDRYGEAVSLKAGVAPKTTTSGLVALDAWFINELPVIIAKHKCLSSTQLCKAVEWKLKRGEALRNSCLRVQCS